jgi:membrane peptidoglycan carboxypeptidase
VTAPSPDVNDGRAHEGADQRGNDWWARPVDPVVLAIMLVPTLIVGAGLLLGAGLAPSAGVVASVVRQVDDKLVDFPPLEDLFRRPDERSVVLASDGSLLAVLRAENRKVVPLTDIPAHVQSAVIATEDARFWAHRGVNWEAVGRAAIGNLQAGQITSGASTITQQLIKNLTGQDDLTLQRKLQEAVWATQLERRVSKRQILEAYLNETYFGNGVYGIGTAAEYYFGKSVNALTLDEAALLAGMIRSPGRNDPISRPAAALARRNIVLQQMVGLGLLDSAEADRLASQPLTLNLSPLPTDQNPFFVAYVRNLLLNDPALGPDRVARDRLLLRGGLKIRTTLMPSIQRLADQAIREVLPNRDGPQASLVAINPKTGAILAIGSGPKEFGRGSGRTEVLPAVPGVGSTFGRQPGSAFKAFAIVAALESGVSPTFTVDTPSPYQPTGICQQLDPSWQPGNYSDSGGGVLNMAEAVAKSSNVYFSRLVDQFTGPAKLIETARRMGVTHSKLEPFCGAVLGTEEVYPLDMASAFGTLANDGVHCEPYAISEVRDRDGRVLLRGGNTCERAVDQGIARRATALLQGPITHGTASRNGQIGRPAAGKTGTTSEYRDAWFTGFIPQLSAAVWIGYEQPAVLYDSRCSGGRVTGGCLPTMIWQQFMRSAIGTLALPVESFGPPPPPPTAEIPNVVGQSVDVAKALLQQMGFFPEVRTVPDQQPAGTVIASDPPAGAHAELGRPVRLIVSDGTGPPPAPASAEPEPPKVGEADPPAPEFSPPAPFTFPFPGDDPYGEHDRHDRGYDPYGGFNPYGGDNPYGGFNPYRYREHP